MFHHFFNYKKCINYFQRSMIYDDCLSNSALYKYSVSQYNNYYYYYHHLKPSIQFFLTSSITFQFSIISTLEQFRASGYQNRIDFWMNSKFRRARVRISLGYIRGLDRLDEDVAEKYDPSGVASGRTSQISVRYFSRERTVRDCKALLYVRGINDVIHAYSRT